MIVVRLELWPGGDSRAMKQIALLGIVNVGLGRDGKHVYEARFEGRVADVSHARSDGALALVARAIEALTIGSLPDPLALLAANSEMGQLAPDAGDGDTSVGRRPARQKDR